MYPDAVILSNLNPNPDILIPGEQERIGNRLQTSEFYQIGNNQGINTLLLPVAINESETQLHVIIDEDPLTTVVRGTGKTMADETTFKAVFIN